MDRHWLKYPWGHLEVENRQWYVFHDTKIVFVGHMSPTQASLKTLRCLSRACWNRVRIYYSIGLMLRAMQDQGVALPSLLCSGPAFSCCPRKTVTDYDRASLPSRCAIRADQDCWLKLVMLSGLHHITMTVMYHTSMMLQYYNETYWVVTKLQVL